MDAVKAGCLFFERSPVSPAGSQTGSVLLKLLLLTAFVLFLSGCSGDPDEQDPKPLLKDTLDIKETTTPAKFRSLGSANAFFEIKGIKEKPAKVSLPLGKKRAVWFHPDSLKLALWDKDRKSFQFIKDSIYDKQTGNMQANLGRDGVYAVFGLSRARHVYDFQAKLCRWKLEPDPVLPPRDVLFPPDCTRILCPAFDARAWSEAWRNETGEQIFPEDIRGQFGNICDQCFGQDFGPLETIPECEIVAIDPEITDFIPVDFPCPDCKRVCPDNDNDTVCNAYESCLGTDPDDPDSDDDGLNDGDELDRGTRPLDPDTDGDNLTDGDEVNNRNTDPLDRDTDDDGLEDGWEVLGYDSNNDGTRDINLPALGTNPRRKDILVELDWMFSDRNGDGDTLDVGENLQPQAGAINNVINIFANAPVPNPDGTNGINLIVNTSNGIAEVNLNGNLLAFDAAGNYTGFTAAFNNIKTANMTAGMASISRYSLWIRNFNARGSSGIAENIISDDFVVSLGLFATVGGTFRQQQSTFMHELGHTLGLYHGGTQVTIAGSPNYDRNFEPNYPSIMNYFHQFPGVIGNWTYGNPPACAAGRTTGRLCFTQGAGPAWTYSQGQLANVNEACLNEATGTTGLPGPIDWNLDGDTTDNCVSIDLQADGDTGVQDDHDDWADLVYKFW